MEMKTSMMQLYEGELILYSVRENKNGNKVKADTIKNSNSKRSSFSRVRD